MKRKHKDREEVKNAMKLPKKSQALEFRKFINQDILKTNIEEAGKDNPNFERIRQSKSASLVMCGNCCVFITPAALFNHKIICNGIKKAIDVRLLAKPTVETSEDLKKNVIATLRNDIIGLLCKTDRTILLCGYWSYQKTKKSNNKIGARDSIWKEMRFPGHCYTHFIKPDPKV